MQAGHAGFGAIARDLRAGDVHPPLYFWAVAAWRWLVGDGLFAARLFSVLCGVGCTGTGGGDCAAGWCERRDGAAADVGLLWVCVYKRGGAWVCPGAAAAVGGRGRAVCAAPTRPLAEVGRRGCCWGRRRSPTIWRFLSRWERCRGGVPGRASVRREGGRSGVAEWPPCSGSPSGCRLMRGSSWHSVEAARASSRRSSLGRVLPPGTLFRRQSVRRPAALPQRYREQCRVGSSRRAVDRS